MTRINKYELVTEIAMLCDELDACRRELEDLRRGADARTAPGGGGGLDVIDLMCLNAGRMKIFNDCTHNCRTVHAWRDEDTGEINATSFEESRENAFRRCPDSMSKRDFFEYFDADFRAKYEEDRARAVDAEAIKVKEGEDD
ncbi:MAG: hypothetical protein E7001_02965 [Coriobacteriaceae bacterium]|nr:hypothetical protein [Coriobacteriaceae bacterium]